MKLSGFGERQDLVVGPDQDGRSKKIGKGQTKTSSPIFIVYEIFDLFYEHVHLPIYS